jgi:cyanophycinase
MKMRIGIRARSHKILWLCIINPRLLLLTIVINLFITHQLYAQSRSSTVFPHAGKLIIIGGGSIPDTIFNLFAAAIGGRDQSVVVIPTATGDENYINDGGHLKKFSERGFALLKTIHTRDREKAGDQAFVAMMKEARGLFFGGGDQQRLADAYGDTRLHEEMRALLDRGGVIMGTSAGASIMGSVLMGGDHRLSPHKVHQLPNGLGFMSHTAIDQHVLVRNRQFDMLPLMRADTMLFGIAIDESTAAIVERDVLSVAGDSYVLVYDRQIWKRQEIEWGAVHRPFLMLRAGQRYDLKKHEIIK